MKATNCITGTLLTVSLLVFLVSCSSNDVTTTAIRSKKQSVENEKQPVPPMIVRQFGGCKAHQ